ncbi:biotin--protein ligase [Neocloeon triangulifer]|uniref:biotin--protein ligase n=1 Tax=Neocloeon triangulifer TaxID=2078957 RepID=UPI00286F3EEE|nr:biotin--protein ligase [Neocloeon triangulifer]
MFLSLFYAAATWVQSSRLADLHSRILQITAQNGSVVLYKVPDLCRTDAADGGGVDVPTVTSRFCENNDCAKLGDLLWSYRSKRLCSVFPKQSIPVSRWIKFSVEGGEFPISVGCEELVLGEERLLVLVEADYQFTAGQHCLEAEFVKLEKFGLLRAWKAGEFFGILLESDANHLTRLGLSFMQNTLSLDDGMEVLRIQTVDVLGKPCPLLNADSIPAPRSLPLGGETSAEAEQTDADFSIESMAGLLMSPIQWRSHVDLLRSFSAAVDEADGSMGLMLSADRVPNLVPVDAPTPPSSPRNGSIPTSEEAKVVMEEKKLVPTLNGVNETADRGSVVSGVTSHSDSFYSCASQDMGRLTESLEQLNKALASITDEPPEEPTPLPPLRSNSISKFSTLSKPAFKGSTASLPSPTPKSRSPSTPLKCPNVLIYCDNTDVYESIKALLRQTLKKYRYTMYNVNAEQMKSSAWLKSTALVVVHGNVPEKLAPLLISYLVTGGKVLCIASSMIFVPFPELRSVPVQPDQLASFSYQKWKQTRLLHQIFTKPPSLPPSLEVKDNAGFSHKLNVTILSTEDKSDSPSLLVASMVGSGGKLLFSQVHLEVEAKSRQNSNAAVFAPLKENDSIRVEIARDLLSGQLGLECAAEGKEDAHTAAFFLGKHECKMEFFAQVKAEGNVLQRDALRLEFCGKGVAAGAASDTVLPCYLHTCPPHFNTVEYFDTLETEHLGRLLIYSDVMSSSMDVLNGGPLWHGLAAVPRVQLKGKGRSKNEWLSPEGCAMFSLQLHFPTSSVLGQKVSLVQHIAALAVCVAVREAPGFEDVDLRLKWPNDIYAGDYAKLGGLIATSSFQGDQVVCNIGLGFNLTNSEPTTCLQDLLLELKAKTAPMSLERFLALTFNRLEALIDLAQTSEQGLDEIMTFYHAYWLHSNSEVTVQTEDGKEQRVTVQGLDAFGYLAVRGADGTQFSVHPDGNSFDMLQGLIRPKD